MSEPIKVGDLVMQVRACCQKMEATCTRTLGVPFTVTEVYSCHGTCPHCGFNGANLSYAGTAPDDCDLYVGWLKRIPSLSELEGNFTATEIEHRKQDFAERVRKMQEALRG